MPPLSPSATRSLLEELGHTPRHFLGQNFLVDGNVVRKSLALAEVQPGDRVVEIGPGLGTLTSALLEAGAEVWAVEKDPRLHAHLAATLAPQFPVTLHLMAGDAIEHPLAGFQDLRPPVVKSEPTDFTTGGLRSFKIVANLPYAIATPWLDAVLAGPLPTRIVLMLQREAVERYTARPGTKSFGAISIFLQAAYDVAPGHRVSAACFYPKPEIESCLLNLARQPAPIVFPGAAKSFIRACFQQRRKQIGALVRGRLGAGEPLWLGQLAAAGFSAKTRPEAIPTALWTGLIPLFQGGASV